MQYKIGNGNKISMWHDKWSLMPAIDTILSRRDIYTAGFTNNTAVADCVQNNNWSWPEDWFIKYPILSQYQVPKINADIQNKMLWCLNNGTTTEHAFVLWMESKVEDSHKHLFFEYEYCKTVWEKVQQMANVNNMKSLDKCMRNTRLFHQQEKSSINILKQILGSVSSKLMTLRVKSSSAIKEVEVKWEIILMKVTSINNATLWYGFNPTGFNGKASLPSMLCKPEVRGSTYCHKKGCLLWWNASLVMP
ncbi:hypothetical protein Tco_0808761 [Tanacetum coccineum]